MKSDLSLLPAVSSAVGFKAHCFLTCVLNADVHSLVSNIFFYKDFNNCLIVYNVDSTGRVTHWKSSSPNSLYRLWETWMWLLLSHCYCYVFHFSDGYRLRLRLLNRSEIKCPRAAQVRQVYEPRWNNSLSVQWFIYTLRCDCEPWHVLFISTLRVW